MNYSSEKNFISLVKEIDTEYRTQRDRGTLFELLIKTYLENEPMYQRLFDKVWMLSEVPAEYNIPKIDTGVDLIAKIAKSDKLVAIQCKYYSKDTKIRKEHIDSFLNEVGKNHYSEGLIVTTTDQWTKNADEALNNRDKTIMRISLSQLKESRIDWSKYSFTKPKDVVFQDKKVPRPHQIPAIKSVVDRFKNADRGKLIMAPGTGKTFTSMAIAEEMARTSSGTFNVLYLVPSIQLLSQTLRSWNADINFDMDSIAVCSDRKVTKERIGTEIEDIATADIGFPATTNADKLLEYQQTIGSKCDQPDFVSVFSTYQSIDVIIEAQKNGFYEFDLIVCDEAHRTTGTTELNREASPFTKVHSNNNIKGKKRLYQTATPRVYGEDAKKKAEEKSIVIADMGNPETFGDEFYRIGFGDAIRKDILSDYKVMVLAVDEDVIARRFQDMFSKTESGLQFDDVTKIIGCWNGLVKRDGNTNKTLGQSMKRAIAFTGTIKDSKKITEMFSAVVDEYLYKGDRDLKDHFNVEIQHADGTMNALEKNEKIDWLKSLVPDNTCRILSNARFLTEGVDVPDLDAVMFLKPRKSKIDIAQAVGRVMRKVEGKDYGYIILPIGVPAGAEAHSILDNNEKYAVVWEILNALRSIDERFDAIINKLALNKKKPDQLEIVGVGNPPDSLENESGSDQLTGDDILYSENMTDLERAIYGKIVKKVGNVRYWEQWSEDVAKIAQQHMTRITVMLEDKRSKAYNEFQKFMKSIRHNINDSISEEQAIEMLAQHLVTKPVFEALFASYSFVNNNPVSQAIESILDILDKKGLLKEQERLEKFYESVRIRADEIDNLEAKQKIIIQLYEKFFKIAFNRTTNRLGIVFTPIEIVDFIINSVNDVLEQHFGKSIGGEGVHVLDPFTGTGTFIVRLLQNGLISKKDLLRKYTKELHANEIVLLSYYIAAINIEETFHSIMEGNYKPFEGIVLTDTFESTEKENSFKDELFGENNERLERQQKESIFAIIGNPPYSARQTADNDDNQNKRYPEIDERIKNTYVKHTNVVNKNTLYDPLVRAFRWSTDRIGERGVVGFVTNNSYIDAPTTSGIRKYFYEDFNYLYIINLRGSVRGRSGDDVKREGQNVFNIITGVAVCILVKDGSENHEIKYFDIGDYLSRKDKLEKLNELKSIENVDWSSIIPDKNDDWINQREEKYSKFFPIDPEKNGVFKMKSLGVSTNRDVWVYGFSKQMVNANVFKMVENFNSEMDRLKNIKSKEEKVSQLNTNPTFMSWSRGIRQVFLKGEKISLNPGELKIHIYRPFTKKWLYYDKNIIEMSRKFRNTFGDSNKVILVPGKGARRSFSCLMVDAVPDLNIFDGGAQGFSVYNKKNIGGLFEEDHDNISISMAKEFDLSSEELFYYTYAVLHSKEFREKYQSDLRKELPHIPKLKNKEKYVEIGQNLSELHLNYEKVEPYPEVTINCKTNPSYKVKKMKYQKRGISDKIIFNADITITGIPEQAHEYIINGKSAIEWIMNQYQVNTDKKSGITDDPNLHSDDQKYIFNLLLRVITVSVRTVELVNSLPPLEAIE